MPDLANKNHSVNQDIFDWMQGDHVNLIAIGQLIKAKNFINLIKSIDLLVNKNKQKIPSKNLIFKAMASTSSV